MFLFFRAQEELITCLFLNNKKCVKILLDKIKRWLPKYYTKCITKLANSLNFELKLGQCQ